jgi:hypothetical protein
VSPYWIGAVLAWFAVAGGLIIWLAFQQAAETDRSEDLANALHLEWDEDRDRNVWEMVERHREQVANPMPLPYPKLRVVRGGNEKPLHLWRGLARETPGRADSDHRYHTNRG